MNILSIVMCSILLMAISDCMGPPREFTDKDYQEAMAHFKAWAAEELVEYCKSNNLSTEEFSGPMLIRIEHDIQLIYHVRYYHPTHHFALAFTPILKNASYEGGIQAGIKVRGDEDVDCKKGDMLSADSYPEKYYQKDALNAASKKLIVFAKEHQIPLESFQGPTLTESHEFCLFPIYIISYEHPEYYFHYSLYMNRLWAGKKAGATIDYTDVANLPFITGTLAPREEEVIITIKE
jgi:hypothetical protein